MAEFSQEFMDHQFKKGYSPWNKGFQHITLNKICPVCKNSFHAKPSHFARRKYCSYKCAGEASRGKPTWISTHASKGVRLNTGRTHFQKGQDSPNKGKRMPQTSGENNYKWRGNEVGYFALHHWVRRQLGKPGECVFCGFDRLQGSLNWASISHKANRDLTDYIPLCVKCHKNYDLKGGYIYG